MRAYRAIFGLAALYNVAFGLWAGLWPGAFFQVFRLEPPRYPSIWACVGMVVGVYALAYAAAARRPEEGDLLIGIGLLGKVLGPAGWLMAVGHGELPPRTFPLILANDLVWWFPFLFYLLRGLPARRTVIAWVSVGVHIAASVGLLAAAGGTEVEPAPAQRLLWIVGNAPLWTRTWLCWALASMSLLALCTAWTARLLELGAPRAWAVGACLVCALGVAIDLAGETLNLVWPLQPERTVAEFVWGARVYAFMSVATANGLYCVAGLVLSLLSWRCGFLRGAVGLAGFAMWTVGLVLTAMVLLHQEQGMIVIGGAVMALYIPWAAVVGWKLRLAPCGQPPEATGISAQRSVSGS
jgi:hypothetical protein